MGGTNKVHCLTRQKKGYSSRRLASAIYYIPAVSIQRPKTIGTDCLDACLTILDILFLYPPATSMMMDGVRKANSHLTYCGVNEHLLLVNERHFPFHCCRNLTVPLLSPGGLFRGSSPDKNDGSSYTGKACTRQRHREASSPTPHLLGRKNKERRGNITNSLHHKQKRVSTDKTSDQDRGTVLSCLSYRFQETDGESCSRERTLSSIHGSPDANRTIRIYDL